MDAGRTQEKELMGMKFIPSGTGYSPFSEGKGSIQVRVERETFEALSELAELTGQPLTSVATRLIQYGLQHVELTERKRYTMQMEGEA
jgi:hypothetical protein